MSDVKRWTPVSGMILCVEGGDYIMAEDYDRLRAEHQVANEQRDQAQRWYREKCAEVERLKARVITDEQIDKAWERLSLDSEETWTKYTYGVLETLRDLGIVECPECSGSGLRLPKKIGENFRCQTECLHCHGHGWIREERGDE